MKVSQSNGMRVHYIIIDETWSAISDARLHLAGGLRRRQSCHRDWQGARLLLRHLWRPRHRPPHPHHRQQLHQVLQQAEEVGEERVGGGEGAEKAEEAKPNLRPN